MATVVRKIGLSLGADICWPASYEEILKRLDLAIPQGNDTVRLSTERVTVEPFDLDYQPSYALVMDRLTHWFHTSREWIKKISLDGVYVLNNPWAIQSMEKHTTYVAMMKLGMPIPKTWIIPPKEYETGGDWDVTVRRYNRLFDLGKVGEEVGYPAFLKPYDGGGWVGVTRVTDEKSLRQAYDRSGKRVQHLQAAVKDWDLFIRAIGIGPQVNVVKYDPDQPLHERYRVEFGFVTGEEWLRATRICRTINAFFGWDFNSCEMLRAPRASAGSNPAESILHPIDYANACPDSQVTSLHFHFPWLVKALLRWTIFNAVTGRRKKLTLEWDKYFDAHDPDLDFDEQLARYDAIARQYFSSDQFEEFDARYLGHLDQVAVDFFGDQAFYDIVQQKVEALFPKHEVKQFSDHFFGMVQFWRKTELDRIANQRAPELAPPLKT